MRQWADMEINQDDLELLYRVAWALKGTFDTWGMAARVDELCERAAQALRADDVNL